jgi:hypothetical protein
MRRIRSEIGTPDTVAAVKPRFGTHFTIRAAEKNVSPQRPEIGRNGLESGAATDTDDVVPRGVPALRSFLTKLVDYAPQLT